MKISRVGMAGALAVSAVCLTQAYAVAVGGGPLPPKRMIIGGPGTCGSDGFDDPGRLNDGITEGAALYIFVLDPGAATLTVEVVNTSPVLVGVNNPLLTDIYFNAPVEITGMDLMSQASSAGVDPTFDFTFDADLDTAPNPNGANGFGAFSVGLNDPGGIDGAIANPDADTYVTDPSTLAVSPCTFVFSLTGDLTGLTSRSFKTRYSVVPPGTKVATGSGKFQAGGVAEASGFITSPIAECFLVISPEAGNSVFTSLPSGHAFPTGLGNVDRYLGMTVSAPVTIALDSLPRPRLRNGNRMGATSTSGGRTVASESTHFFVQCFLWNPEEFPTNPEQWSWGLEVTVAPNGAVTVDPFGAFNGMSVGVTPFVGPDGREYLRFPFNVTSE
ncbi:MAG: hypothetical protein ACI8QZ_000943 [Chlamydiales bacterium]|jgi:hypothetical protein